MFGFGYVQLFYEYLEFSNWTHIFASDENPLSFYPGIKDGSKLNVLVIQKKSDDVIQAKSQHQNLGIQLLKEEVSRILRHYYTDSDTRCIVNEMVKDLKNKVANSSYDDLERLATALMMDQENLSLILNSSS